jgi:prepilin signal peptidase PulO-like enzyme (type II secretory pathway)
MFLKPFSEYFIRHYALLFSSFTNPFLSHAIGFFAAGLFFFALVLLTRGKGMGMGDVKLMAAAGFLFGWPDIILGIFFGFLVGGIASTFLYIRKKKGMKDMIPFGPFLVLGLCVLFFFGFQVIDFYFSILG